MKKKDLKFIGPEHAKHLFSKNMELFLVKVITRTWNTTLQSILQSQDVNNPLAHLHLRSKHRSSDCLYTYGMMKQQPSDDVFTPPSSPFGSSPPLPEGLSGFTWVHRKFVQNSDLPEPIRHMRPVIHTKPMYTSQEKTGYSKPQSTTFVGREIHPPLFGSGTRTSVIAEGLSGLILPLDKSFILINRCLKYDRGTFDRPYDNLASFSKHDTTTLEKILLDPSLRGPNAKLTEILARLRICPSISEGEFLQNPSTLPHMTPGLLISKPHFAPYVQFKGMLHSESEELRNTILYLGSILRSINRAYDIKFCIHRHYGCKEYDIPFVVYNPKNDICFERMMFFSGDEDLVEILKYMEAFPVSHRFYSTTPSYNDAFEALCIYDKSYDLPALFHQVCMQQSIYQKLISIEFGHANSIADHMIWHDWFNRMTFYYIGLPVIAKKNLFYTETLRAFLSVFDTNKHFAAQLPEYLLKVKERFNGLEYEVYLRRLYLYTIESDFPNGDIEAKFNPRFPLFQFPKYFSDNYNNALHQSICMSDLQTFNALLNSDAFDIDINKKIGFGDVLLNSALKHSHPINLHMAERLLAFPHIDTEIQDHNGEIALMTAIKHIKYETESRLPTIDELNRKKLQIHDKLFEKCKNINIKNHDGATVLHFAIFAKNFDVIFKIMKRSDVDLGIRDNIGNTPLMIAIQIMDGSNKDEIDFFTQYFQKVNRTVLNLRSKDGSSPLTHAIRLKKYLLIHLLLKEEKISLDDEDARHLIPFHHAATNLDIAVGKHIFETLLEDHTRREVQSIHRVFHIILKQVHGLLSVHLERLNKFNTETASIQSLMLENFTSVSEKILRNIGFFLMNETLNINELNSKGETSFVFLLSIISEFESKYYSHAKRNHTWHKIALSFYENIILQFLTHRNDLCLSDLFFEKYAELFKKLTPEKQKTLLMNSKTETGLPKYAISTLKSLKFDACTVCKQPIGYFTFKHHCRLCFEGFCHNGCGKLIDGNWVCNHCSNV